MPASTTASAAESTAAPADQTPATLVLSPAQIRYNYWLGVINGVLFSLGDSFASAGIVLALLVRQLGGSLALVGLLPALQTGGFLLPQLLIGGRLQSLTYKLPLYRRAAVVRAVAYIALLAAVFATAVFPPTPSLWLIVICYCVFHFAGGTSTLAFQDVVAKVIPSRRLGAFYGSRQLFGGLLTFALVGPIVRWLLGESSPFAFPFNFAALCSLSLVCVLIGLSVFAFVIETPQTDPGKRMRVIDGIRRAPVLMRENRDYRWFIISRMLIRVGQIAEPFYIIYSVEVLQLPDSVAGIYLAVRAISGALSNLMWSRLGERRGTRQLILTAGVLGVLSAVLVLVGPWLLGMLGLGGNWLVLAIGLVFLVSGVANDGNGIAGNTYLIEIVPANERPTYIGLANTTLGLVTFLPVLGGWLVSNVGYTGTFVIGVAFAILGLLASVRLSEPRLRVLRQKLR